MLAIRILDKELNEVGIDSLAVDPDGTITIILDKFVAAKPEPGQTHSNDAFMDRLRSFPTLCPMKPKPGVGSGLRPWK